MICILNLILIFIIIYFYILILILILIFILILETSLYFTFSLSLVTILIKSLSCVLCIIRLYEKDGIGIPGTSHTRMYVQLTYILLILHVLFFFYYVMTLLHIHFILYSVISLFPCFPYSRHSFLTPSFLF